MHPRSALLALVLALAPAAALAQANAINCRAIAVTCSSGPCTAVSIAGGAFTTDAFDARGFSTLKVVGNLTDTSNGVSKLEHALVENFTASGQFEAYPFCVDLAPTLECGQLKLTWQPQTHGKNYLAWIPWRGRHGKLTVTPTGHGAGDTLNLELYGCY